MRLSIKPMPVTTTINSTAARSVVSPPLTYNQLICSQLLRNGGDYKTWTRWGRVGERGQNAILGDGSLPDALRQFDVKFKSKTGLSWDSRGDKPKAGKYTFVERSYNDDSDEEEDTKVEDTKVKEEEEVEAPVSKLVSLSASQPLILLCHWDLDNVFTFY